MADAQLQARTTMVWDPAVRIGHWLIVFAFAVAYLTGEGEDAGIMRIVHVWAGYSAGVIVVLRVLWGLIGPRHARFTDFVYRPSKVVRYAFALLRGHARRYIGHSPAGGAMAIALLICLAGTVTTGLATVGDLTYVPFAGAPHVVARAYAEHEGSDRAGRSAEGKESLVRELHGTLANLTLILVLLHIVGVGVACVVHRENLVRAMIDGRKRPALHRGEP